VTQASPVGQSGKQLVPHGVTPAGQLGGEHAVEPAQLAGNVRLPKQSSHVSQGFKQPWTKVHGLQRVGSSRCEWSHEGAPSSSVEPSHTAVFVPGTAQQPKQSQPFGVSGPQALVHAVD
jgi:hypothetical protein